MSQRKQFGVKDVCAVDAWAFCHYNHVQLASGPFTTEEHEYMIEWLQSSAQTKVIMKGSQMGATESQLLKIVHSMIMGRYPVGAMILQPTGDDISDFTRARLNPLIQSNPLIARHVKNTDSISIKAIGGAMLYLRSARPTAKIAGVKEDASKLRSVPVDAILYDEVDLFSESMILEAKERMSHSKVREETFLSTPSVPSYGIDQRYQESDQRRWFIKCEACGCETCLETSFPQCLREGPDGKVYRACDHCHREIFPRLGKWIAAYPDRPIAGYQISQLCSAYVDPGEILRLYTDPPGGNLQEIMNSKLALPYVPSENKLTVGDVLSCCNNEPMLMSHPGPCAMGVDVGRILNVVVAFRKNEKQLRIAYTARVSSFNDVHDIASRFSVRAAVIDAEPELRKAREFADSEPYQVYLADYHETMLTDPVWDEGKGLVKVNRTSALDGVHALVTGGMLSIPRRSEEVEIFAKHLSSPAKILEENPVTGSRQYRYRKTQGDDHYAHSVVYAMLASGMIGIAKEFTPHSRELAMLREELEALGYEKESSSRDPLNYGLQTSGYNPLGYGIGRDGRHE